MRISQYCYTTMKEIPKEAQIPSHQLMFRAGMMQQLASGIYNLLPLSLKTVRKIEKIIREELEKAGCQEVLMPVVQPAELWKESGRWDYYGAELLRFKDRKDNDYCLGPTHEEVITDLVRRNLKSYKQLPWNIYQVQTKFRDEVRPRFGLMRGREFIMKDGYSFDKDVEGAKETYQKMYDAYTAIFKRCGLEFRAVEAATGNIGGDMSHEFQVLASSGEDEILHCDSCRYAANLEMAQTPREKRELDEKEFLPMEDIHTPGSKTIEEISSFLKKDPSDFIKTLCYIADEEPIIVLVSGDKDVNDAKLQAFLQVNSLELAPEEKVIEITGAATGFAGPSGLKKEVRILADISVFDKPNRISGANKSDYHSINVNPGRDFTPHTIGDFTFAEEGDSCPRCKGKLISQRGIEVGQVFYLGTKYSDAMKCVYLDKDGKEQVSVMGCYGIGVTRTMAASIEQNHDENGIIWPVPIAPFEVVVLPLQMNKENVVEAGESIYSTLKSAGVDVIIDDRNERAGFKFKDADLIGYPLQVVIGGKSLENGEIEVKVRQTGEKLLIPVEDVQKWVVDYIAEQTSLLNGK